MEIIIIFLIIKNIFASECYYRCKTCSHEYIDYAHVGCETCIENTYLLEEYTSCYYTYELPGLYLTSLKKYEYCSENCYECIDEPTKCISCKRGYTHIKSSNSCEQCNLNNYYFVNNAIEYCQEGELSIFTCQLEYTKCTNININTENFECPREYPLLINNKKECALEIYNEAKHIISNKIIKTQWLNKRIQIGEEQCWFIRMDFSSKGDLIMETNEYNKNVAINTRYFYGIKSNGRPFFYNSINNKFEEKIAIEANTNFFNYESQLIKIKLVNDDEKDYYLSCSFTECSLEIADFYNNKIVGISQKAVFGKYYWSTKLFSILELKNEKNVYLFCFIALNISKHYVFLQKIKFYKSDLSKENSYEKIKYTESNSEYAASQSKIISCHELSVFNIIQCFYINIEKYYVLSLFDEDSLNLIKTFIIDNTNLVFDDGVDWDYFFQSILIKDNVSVLGYILDPNSNLIYIQIKMINKYKEYVLENYFLKNKKIIINKEKKYDVNSFYFISHLKKLNEDKFCLITTSKNNFDIYITIFDFYAFRNTNLIIRYYHIPLKLYDLREFQFILSVNFNGFLGLVFTNQKLTWNPAIHYFSIFSYINSRDSELITLDLTTTLQLNDYINGADIENNLFGVELYGIKIIKLPKNIGIYYFSRNKNNLIYENDILEPNDIIIFIYDYTELKKGKIYTIEMAGAVKEPPYEEFNKYPEYIEYFGKQTQESFYKQKILIGKTCFYNFTILDSLTGINDNSCKANCKLCYNTFCIKCVDNYYIKEDTNNCIIKSIINGFYFDDNNDLYRKCNETCKACSKGPIYFNDIHEVNDSNCDSCIDNYYKIINTNNCINKNQPPISYYLDINQGLFLPCYYNCMTCIEPKKNSTYFNCLKCDDNSIFYEKSGNCLNCVIRDKYVNYYQYDCIEKIPDGYYLLNKSDNSIDKCYYTCKSCIESGNSVNHKCLECSEAYPYNYNNGEKCLDDCSKENLYLDIEDKICYNDCLENINDRKYNYKNKCVDKNENIKNYELNDGNSFISVCNPKSEYEFNNECYNSCPEGTKLDQTIVNKNLCICNYLYYLNGENYICINSNICPIDYPYLKINTSECINYKVKYKEQELLSCPNNNCITQINPNLITCIEQIQYTHIINDICFDDFAINLDYLESLESNQTVVINENPSVSLVIYEDGLNINLFKFNYSNLTYMNLGECHDKLIDFYNLNKNEKLYILSVDSNAKLSKKYTNDYSFEIYLKNGTKLEDLSICKNIPLSISFPIINEKIINFNLAKEFYDQGYNIYNLSSDFYNNKCTIANINNSDIIIADRLNDVYPINISICPNNCELESTDIDSKRINCLCDINNSIELNDEKYNIFSMDTLFNSFIDLNNINIDILKCYKVLLTKKGLVKNIGSYFIISIFIILMINSILFFIIDYKLLFNQIESIIQKYQEKATINNMNKKNKVKNLNLEKCSFKSNDILFLNEIKENKSDNKILEINKIENNNNNNKQSPKKIVTNNNIIKYQKTSSIKSMPKIDRIKEKDKNNDDKNNIMNKNNIDIINNNKNILDFNDYELNTLKYEEALKYDKRTYIQYYWCLLKQKHLLLFSFLPLNDYNSLIIKISLFFFIFSLNFTVNALFFNDSTMHKIYKDEGKFDFIYQMPQIIYSTIITAVIGFIIKFLALTEKNVIEIKKIIKKGDKSIVNKKIKYIIIKVILFFILSYLFLIIFWNYLSCFCALYNKTQIHLIKDTISSFALSFIYPIFLNLLPGIFRIQSLKSNNYERMYKISKIMQII